MGDGVGASTILMRSVDAKHDDPLLGGHPADETILGHDEIDLEQALKAIAANIGGLHIAYAPLWSQKSEDANLLSAICTYPVAWQARYFKKQYARIDPVIAWGNEAVLPFDWDELPKDDPAVRAFFDDAVDHDVGRNGLSIPIRNRK